MSGTTSPTPFGYHIYDLSRGIGQRFAASLLGEPLPQGVLHAAIVIFGYEYFFEGGISKRPAGCSRFGRNFSFVPCPVPATAVADDVEFDRWVRFLEMNRWGAMAYHLTNHNCIHFVDHATRFLTEGRCDGAPGIVRNNMLPLTRTPAGRLLADVAKLMSGASMVKPAEDMQLRRMCRIQAAHVRAVVTGEEGGSIKPTRLFAFGPVAATTTGTSVSASAASSTTTEALVELAQRAIHAAFAPERIGERAIAAERLAEIVTLMGAPLLMRGGCGGVAVGGSRAAASTCNEPDAMPSLSTAGAAAASSSSTVVDGAASARMTGGEGEAVTLSVAVAQAFQSPALCASFDSLSLLLSLFSRLLLHEAFVQCVACDQLFRAIFHKLGKTFFVALPCALKAQVLELFCNALAHPVTAAPMSRLPRSWLGTTVFLVARGLLEPSSWLVVHRASCLFANFLYAHVTCGRVAVDGEVVSRGAEHHPVLKTMGAAWFVAGRVVPNGRSFLSDSASTTTTTTVAPGDDEQLDDFVQRCATPEGAAKYNHRADLDSMGLSDFLSPEPPSSSSSSAASAAALVANAARAAGCEDDEAVSKVLRELAAGGGGDIVVATAPDGTSAPRRRSVQFAAVPSPAADEPQHHHHHSSNATTPEKNAQHHVHRSTRSRAENERLARELDATTHAVLTNIVEGMFLFCLQGHSANKFVQQHPMAVPLELLGRKCKSGSAAKTAVDGMAMIN